LKYLLYGVGLLLTYAIGSGIYDQLNYKPLNGGGRLECQTEVIFFENGKGDVEPVKRLLKERKYSLTSSIQKSVYMESKLFEIVSLQEVDQMVVEKLGKSSGDGVDIVYFIYENDKLHPGKKGRKSKLYSGYLNFDFQIDGDSIYQSQIDFMELDGSDIEKRLECLLESFFTY
jgi:hypothetical protein